MERATGRSRGALHAKLRGLTGQGALSRGAYSLAQLQRDTGYTYEQLRRAASALNQKWKRLQPTGRFLVTEEQREEIITWLKHDYWATVHRLYSCLFCTTERRPHRALGLCERCYFSYMRACKVRGLPFSPKEIATKLACVGASDKLPPQVLARVKRGLAIEREYLDRLAGILPVEADLVHE